MFLFSKEIIKLLLYLNYYDGQINFLKKKIKLGPFFKNDVSFLNNLEFGFYKSENIQKYFF